MTGVGEGGHFRGETRSRSCPLGPNVQVTQGLWTEKSKLYARILVSQGPSGTMAWGGRRRGRVPDGLPDRSPDAARNALVRPSQATKISKPNRFGYLFRSRPRGVYRPLWLNLPEHQTSNYEIRQIWGSMVHPRAFRNLRSYDPTIQQINGQTPNEKSARPSRAGPQRKKPHLSANRASPSDQRVRGNGVYAQYTPRTCKRVRRAHTVAAFVYSQILIAAQNPSGQPSVDRGTAAN